MTPEEQHQAELENKENFISRVNWLNYAHTAKVLLDLAERRRQLLKEAEEFSQGTLTYRMVLFLTRSKEIDRIIHLLKTGEYE